jgi:hypothetical protein
MPWTNWLRFSEKNVNPATSCKSGVYQVRATLMSRKPVPIHRACGVDYDGILYIGQGILEDRVGLLMNIHQDNAKFHHDFTRKFNEIGFERICDREFLEIRWLECDEPLKEERRLLEEYKKQFGDIPPGNLNLGG